MERWRENARARMLAGQRYSRQAVERPVEARERYARRAREIMRTTK